MPGIGTISIKKWPAQSREAARRVIEQYGEPDEVTADQLIWHKRGPWRQIIASKSLYQHNFPAPHYTLFALENDDAVAPAALAAAKASKRRPRRSVAAAALGKLQPQAASSSAA